MDVAKEFAKQILCKQLNPRKSKRIPFQVPLSQFRRRRSVKQTYQRYVCSAGLQKARAFWDVEETQSVSTLDVAKEFAKQILCKQLNPHKTKRIPSQVSFTNSGDVLLSRAVAHQVSSALRSLTTVFGMGTGVTFLLLPPNICQSPCGALTLFFLCLKN